MNSRDINRFLGHYNAETGMLDLNGQHLNHDDIKDLVSFLKLHPNINKLDVSYNNLKPRDAELLAGIHTLTCLIATHNRFSDNGAVFFSLNTSLLALNLFNNQISDDGAEKLANNETLMVLNLGDNNITDVGAQKFVEKNRLHSLDLSANEITDVTLVNLASKTTSIKSLDVSVNRGITVKGIKAIASNPFIEKLAAKHRNLSDESEQALTQPDPFKRFLNAREAGVNPIVPSLQSLCLFKLRIDRESTTPCRDVLSESRTSAQSNTQ